MNNTRKIILTLRTAGLNAYYPGVHDGTCISPYCVVQSSSAALVSRQCGYIRYRVHLYVPLDLPEQLDILAESVRDALLPLEKDGCLALAEPRGTTVTDDDFRALCSYIDYVSYYSER